MQRMTLDVEAGQVSAELAHRGIPARARIHVLVEVADDTDPPMAALAEAGDAPAEWLAAQKAIFFGVFGFGL